MGLDIKETFFRSVESFEQEMKRNIANDKASPICTDFKDYMESVTIKYKYIAKKHGKKVVVLFDSELNSVIQIVK